ncbi:MAG: hypothetical protein IK142_05235 [Clostridiales bacterium]|nr:hypothetical protein [Clostridiales bacterium]
MKRFIALVLTLVMLSGSVGCANSERNGRRGSGSESGSGNKSEQIEELQSHEGTMLEIVSTVRLPVEEGSDIENTVIVEYSGDAYEVDTNYLNCHLSDEEYLTIYNFCVESVENDTFADYYEDACDGITYRFTFYDEDGNAHLIYDGYIYENAELNSIIGIFGNYYID